MTEDELIKSGLNVRAGMSVTLWHRPGGVQESGEPCDLNDELITSTCEDARGFAPPDRCPWCNTRLEQTGETSLYWIN